MIHGTEVSFLKKTYQSEYVITLDELPDWSTYAGGTDATHITVQGTENADVYERGTGLTSQDALEIQKYLLKLVESLK